MDLENLKNILVDEEKVDSLNPYVDAMDDKFIYAPISKEDKILVLAGQLLSITASCGIVLKGENIINISESLLSQGALSYDSYITSFRSLMTNLKTTDYQKELENIRIDINVPKRFQASMISVEKYKDVMIPTKHELNQEKFRKNQEKLRRKHQHRRR